MPVRDDDLVTLVKTTGGNKQEQVSVLTFNAGFEARIAELEKYVPQAGEPDIAAAAIAILTAAGAVSAGNTVTVNDVTYTFRTTLTTDPATVPNEILIGANKEASMTNLKLAINGEETEGTNYSDGTEQPTDVTATVDGAAVTCTATTAGAAGNAYLKAAVGANLDWDGTGAAFTGGVDGSIATAGQYYYDDDKIYLATDDCTISESNFAEYSKDAE